MSTATESALLGEMREAGYAARSPSTGILVAAAIAHRAVTVKEVDLKRGLTAGDCAVCGTPWPCPVADLFLAGTSAHAIKTQEDAAREAARLIMVYVDWDKSDMGSEYWSNVHDNLCALAGEVK